MRLQVVEVGPCAVVIDADAVARAMDEGIAIASFGKEDGTVLRTKDILDSKKDSVELR